MAVGEIIQARTNADGWQLIPEIEGLGTGAVYNVGSGAGAALDVDADWAAVAAVQLYVDSPGYSITGAVTTVGRSIYGTKLVRKPYPDQATLDEVVNASTRLECKVALDDYLYSGESGVVAGVAAAFAAQGGNNSLAYSGAVTNSSTLTYPRVIMRALTVPYQRVTGTWNVEFVCDHLYARNGKPVACVKVTASDTGDGGSTTHEVTASYVRKQFAGSGLYCGVYRATFDAATFGQGLKIKVTAKAFPWVGGATACIDSAVAEAGIVGDGTAPSELLSPLWFHGDKNDALGVYAVVDIAQPDDTAGTVSSSYAAAAADSIGRYRSMVAAITAIKAFNNAAGRGSTADGGVLLMVTGAHWAMGTITGGNTKSFTTIRPHPTLGTEAGAVISTALNQNLNLWVHLKDMTLSTSGTGAWRGNTVTGVLWFDSCTVNLSGAAPVYQWAVCFATDNTVTALNGGFNPYSTNRSPWAVVAGNVGSGANVGATLYCVVGNKRIACGPQADGNAQGHAVSDNTIVQNNESAYAGGPYIGDTIGKTLTINHGMSIAGNVIAKITDAVSPLLQVGGDGALVPMRQAIVRLNACAGGTGAGGGGRANLFYNDTGSTAPKRILCDASFNAFSNVNIKEDLFTTANAARIENWSAEFGVRIRGMVSHYALFGFEYAGRKSNLSATFAWADDHSLTGSNDGGGSYATTGHTANRIPAGEAPAGWDLYGNEISDTGTGYAGGVQPPVPPTVGVVLGGQRGNVGTDGLTITVPLSETGCTPASGTLGFTVGGTTETVTGWVISGGTVVITMSGAIPSTATVTLSYNSAAGGIEDEVGNPLASFADYAIRNDSTAGGAAAAVRGRVVARGRLFRRIRRRR